MKTKSILPILLLSLTLAACEQKVNQENYNLVQKGMELSEVEKLLGKGELQDEGGTSIGAGGLTGGSSANSQKTYQWKIPGKEISVTFGPDGKMVTKNSHGL